MKKFSLIFFLFFLSSCAPVLIGTGIVAGYTLSNDSAIGNVKSTYSNLWDICIKKINNMEGEILLTKESSGLIKAKISSNSITIKIDTITSDTQKLRVSARRFCIPQPYFAQKIFFKIVEDLK